MKQYITIEQLNELSEESKEKLRVWWKPQCGDLVVKRIWDDSGKRSKLVDTNQIRILQELELVIDNENGASIMTSNDYTGDKGYIREHKGEKLFTPVLSIGKMIEFLGENNTGDEDAWINFHVRDIRDLCDFLWEKVKEKLNKSV